MQFGGAHYTAIVRVYHAWQEVTGLRDLYACDNQGVDGHLLHLIHRACSSLWWNLGSAIDNLGKVLEDAPPIKLEGGKSYLTERYQPLKYAYDRRTQAIHSRLIPIGVDGGLPTFFSDHMLAAKYTDWTSKFSQQEVVQDFYEKAWSEFLPAMGNAWWHVFSMMQERDVDRPDPWCVTPRLATGSSGALGDLTQEAMSPPFQTPQRGSGSEDYSARPPEVFPANEMKAQKPESKEAE